MKLAIKIILAAVGCGLFVFVSTAQAQVCRSGPPGQFGVITYCASSALPSQGRHTYGPLNAAGDARSAWVEGGRLFVPHFTPRTGGSTLNAPFGR